MISNIVLKIQAVIIVVPQPPDESRDAIKF